MGKSRRILPKNIGIYLIALVLIIFSGTLKSEEDWQERKSMHFIVYYKECSENFLDSLLNKAEDGYREITRELRFFRDEPWVWKKRATIYVFATKEDYLKDTSMPDWSVGCARPFEKTIFTYAESYKFFHYVLTHELAHLILREFIGQAEVPLWLDEGVAIYMERKGKFSQFVGRAERMVKEAVYIPFEEFFSTQFTDLDKERDPDKELEGDNYVEMFYLQSFSLVYFLIKEYDNYRFIRLLRQIRDGGDKGGIWRPCL